MTGINHQSSSSVFHCLNKFYSSYLVPTRESFKLQSFDVSAEFWNFEGYLLEILRFEESLTEF